MTTQRTTRAAFETLRAQNPVTAALFLDGVGTRAIYGDPSTPSTVQTEASRRRALIEVKHRDPVQRFVDHERTRIALIADAAKRAEAKAKSDAKIAELTAQAETAIASELASKGIDLELQRDEAERTLSGVST